MTRLLKYIGYFTLSLIMALISFFAGEERDFLFMFSKNLIPVLITIVVLYTTLSNLILNQLTLYKDLTGADIHECVKALKRNVYFEFAIIAFDFIIILIANILFSKSECAYILCGTRIFVNMITFFSVFYFLYIVYDSTIGFYNIYNEIINKKQ